MNTFRPGDRVVGAPKESGIRSDLIGVTGTVLKTVPMLPTPDTTGAPEAVQRLVAALSTLVQMDFAKGERVLVKLDKPVRNQPEVYFAPHHLAKLDTEPAVKLDEAATWAALEQTLGFDLRRSDTERRTTPPQDG